MQTRAVANVRKANAQNSELRTVAYNETEAMRFAVYQMYERRRAEKALKKYSRRLFAPKDLPDFKL